LRGSGARRRFGRAALVWCVTLIGADAPEEPWDISSASTSATRGEDGSRIISFTGEVLITHGAMTATSDNARYLEGPRRVLLEGRVVMEQDSTVVRAPFAYYDRGLGVATFPYGVLIERPTGTAVADVGVWHRTEKRFELRGGASAADTSGTLDAEQMTYDTAGEILWAVGDARLVDDVTGVIVSGQNLRYSRAESEAVATGVPTAVFADEQDVDVHVAAERLTYDPGARRAVAEGSVHIRREGMEATCGRATFFRDEDRAVLEEEPTMVDGSSIVTGERIEMRTPEPGRRVVLVEGAASVSNRFLTESPRPEPAEPEEGDAAEPEEAGDAAAAATESLLAGARDRVEEAADKVRERVKLPDSTGAVPEVPDVVPAEQIVEEAIVAASTAIVAAADSAAAARDSTVTAAADGAAAAPADTTEAEPLPPWLKTPSDELPVENLLFGDRITMYFVDDAVEHVVVVGRGRSKFFPSEAQGELTEWNDVTGDTLYVWFDASDVDSVHVVGSGEGQYRFPAGESAGQSADELRAAGKLVDYDAPFIRYIRGVETMHLDRGAAVRYKTMTLTSGRIDFEARKETMTASGDPPPVLVDREDEIHGARMNYHLPSGKGEILTGRTEFEAGYYRGRDVWKMGEDVLAVDHAEYTSCDLEEPHYHFACRNMKIYLDNRMVARPVVLKIRQIPIFALPFYMTSLRKDRHSGFLLPRVEFGVDDERGRFIRNFGYYWVPNDYADATLTFDYFPARDQFVTYLDTRYHLRYRFEGSVGLKYNRDVAADRRERAVEIRHQHQFSETSRLTANASFISANSIYQNIDDSRRLDRDLSSHATFTKRFGEARNLQIEARRNENLDDGSFTQTLPSITFTQPSVPVTGRSARAEAGAEAKPNWLDEIYYKVDGRAVSQRQRNVSGAEEEHIGSTVDGRLTTTQDLLRYLRLSPAMNGEATWIDEDRAGEHNAFRATYDASLTARTDLYGTFLHPIGPVQGFRHVIRPSVSWGWTPAFPEYFFVEEGDTTGTELDRFFSFGGIRGTPREANRMNFSLGNLIQTKVNWAGEERRYDLLNLGSSISYDLLAEDAGRKPLTPLNNSLTVLSAAPVNQTWTVSHDPYSWDLLGSSVTTRAVLASRRKAADEGLEASPEATEDELGGEFEDPVGGGRGPGLTGRYTAGDWQATLSHTAHRSGSGSTTSNLVVNTTWSPTANWQVNFDYQYDLKEGINTAQSFSVRRMVHCWDISFDRRLLGGDWQYYLRVNVTDLPDIQIERGDRTSGRGFGTSTLPF
jgi:lipopolysaccharide assembly outer membrane protein LptD (OstA)